MSKRISGEAGGLDTWDALKYRRLDQVSEGRKRIRAKARAKVKKVVDRDGMSVESTTRCLRMANSCPWRVN
jgi:hypothetical protein